MMPIRFPSGKSILTAIIIIATLLIGVGILIGKSL
jgi:hypothetical protein